MLKKLLPYILVGFVIRIILSSISYHQDIRALDMAGYQLMRGNILNFYDSVPNYFIYPPLAYFTVGLFDGITTSFEDPIFHNDFLFNYQRTLGDPRLNIHLIILKVPYLIFDFGVLWLITQFFKSEKEKRFAALLWIFNPITLYSTYLIGQFDITIVFFILLALYCKDYRRSAVVLGLGAGFKPVPLILAVPLASKTTSWRDKILSLSISLITYLILLIPFLPSRGFRSSALLSDLSLKSLYAQIPISGGEAILLFPAVLIFIYLIFIYKSSEMVWQRFFLVLLLFFILTHTHPQWFLWLTPFFIFDLVTSWFKNIVVVLLMLISYLVLLTCFDTGLTINLFSPLSGQFHIVDNLWKSFGRNIDINQVRSQWQTVFVGGALYLIYRYFPEVS